VKLQTKLRHLFGGSQHLEAKKETFLSVPLEAGFGEVDVVLDAAEDFVLDGVLVAQGDDGIGLDPML
jgi:hypothetical protein